MSTTTSSSMVSPKHRRWKTVTAGILIAVFAIWVGFVAFMWRAMRRPPEAFARVMSHLPWEVFLIVPFETLWTRARAGSMQVGDPVPDFSLLKLDKSGSVRLSELNQAQPVVMIFGSYT